MPITYSRPSSIELEVDGRTVEIDAQGHARGHGSPDFIVYVSAMTRWADGSAITAADKARILEELQSSAKEKGWTLQIE